MKLIVNLLALTLLFGNTQAQDVLLVYKTPIASIKKDSSNQKSSDYDFLEGERYIIINKESRSINYTKAFEEQKEIEPLYLKDKKKNQFKNIEFIYNKQNKIYTYSKLRRPWRDTKEQSDIIQQYEDAKIELIDKTKSINGYQCKLAYYITKYHKTLVWYTEEFHYNWVFEHVYSTIPGTVVRAIGENAEEPVFELISKQDLDLSKTIISKENYNLILKNWKKDF
jgi:GLPGLI family protein